MDESGFAWSNQACAASGAEPCESIFEDPVIARMPGPVQEVFYQLDLVQAFFLRYHDNQHDIVLQQSCMPYNFILSRDCISPGTTLWLRGKSDRCVLVSSIPDIVGILSLFGDLNFTQEREVYWTTNDFLCSSFAAGCTQPSESTGIVRFAVVYQLAADYSGYQVTIVHISIDTREFICPTFGFTDENMRLIAFNPCTYFLGYFLLSIMCVLGLIEKS